MMIILKVKRSGRDVGSTEQLVKMKVKEKMILVKKNKSDKKTTTDSPITHN